MERVPDTLRIELPERACRIGILPSEQDRRQPVRAAVTLELDMSAAMESGRIEDAVDYAPLHAALVAILDDGRWGLIESVAAAMLAVALEADGVRAATVEVTKISPPLGEAAGPVTVTVRRESR